MKKIINFSQLPKIFTTLLLSFNFLYSTDSQAQIFDDTHIFKEKENVKFSVIRCNSEKVIKSCDYFKYIMFIEYENIFDARYMTNYQIFDSLDNLYTKYGEKYHDKEFQLWISKDNLGSKEYNIRKLKLNKTEIDNVGVNMLDSLRNSAHYFIDKNGDTLTLEYFAQTSYQQRFRDEWERTADIRAANKEKQRIKDIKDSIFNTTTVGKYELMMKDFEKKKNALKNRVMEDYEIVNIVREGKIEDEKNYPLITAVKQEAFDRNLSYKSAVQITLDSLSHEISKKYKTEYLLLEKEQSKIFQFIRNYEDSLENYYYKNLDKIDMPRYKLDRLVSTDIYAYRAYMGAVQRKSSKETAEFVKKTNMEYEAYQKRRRQEQFEEWKKENQLYIDAMKPTINIYINKEKQETKQQ